MKIINSIFKEKKENRPDGRQQYQRMFKFVENGVAVFDRDEIPGISEMQQHNAHLKVIDLTDVARSMRFNPMQHRYLPTLTHCQTLATSLMSAAFNPTEHRTGSDLFYETSAVNFLAACIFFFVNYKRLPYDANGKELLPEYITADPETGQKKLSGRVYNADGESVEPACWLGKYSDMPHVLSFLNHDDKEIIEILATDPEVYPLLGPFMTAYRNKAMEQLEGMIGTLRVGISRLATKEAYWIFHKDGDDFIPFTGDCLLLAADCMPEIVFNIYQTLVTMTTQSISCNREPISDHPTVRHAAKQIFYEFRTQDEKERILTANYLSVGRDVENLIMEVECEYTKD